MSGSTLRDNERGVSPVVGIVLLIAITFMLAGTVAAFAFGLGSDAQRPSPPTVAFDFDYEPDPSGDELTITHKSGENLDAERVYVTVSDSNCFDLNRQRWEAGAFGVSGSLGAGESMTIDGGTPTGCSSLQLRDATVRVTWDSDVGSSAELASWRGSG